MYVCVCLCVGYVVEYVYLCVGMKNDSNIHNLYSLYSYKIVFL